MKIFNCLVYLSSFILLVACGSTSKTTSGGNDTAVSKSTLPDDDYDGVANAEDKCPYIFGTARTNGCPDADLDGIQDSEDSCPDEKGYANLKGCLDRDYDGVIDPEDKCPDAYGEGLLGCPNADETDLDGDGVKNQTDLCPDLTGMFTAKGCPDGDGDGVRDQLDACPDLFGSSEFDGCPLALGDMLAIAKLNGHPSKNNGIAEKGYYKNYDGNLYDRNDLSVDVVAGDIVDQKGTFITDTKLYVIDRDGFIRNVKNAGIIRIDEEGYAFGPQGLLSKKQVNGGQSAGGIQFGDFEGPQNNGSGITFGPSDNNSNPGNSSNLNQNIYNNSRNSQPLSSEEAADCNRINLATLTAAIYFDYDADKADNSSLRQLNRVVDAMRKCTKLELQVGGYADSDGADSYNIKLSEKRAKSVIEYISGKGVSDRRLKYNAYGEKYPLASNRTEDGKQQNRRAEIQVSRSN
jgi:outer membrane protein OmpA-like peptidoglycan-associated protein/major membrane immunogen (membrane-anchored lipoprotein)